MLLSKIKTYPKNAKKHDKKQIQQVANSIKRFGFVQPIVIDKNNEVVIGHCRLEAAKLLGLKEVPTISVENLSEKEVRALRLADNKLNESAWDMDLAISDLKELDEDLLNLTGFDKDLLIEPDEKDDIVPDNAPTRAKLGDIWALGRHRVMCGDSTDKASVERLMDGKKADMSFTSPPYNVGHNLGYEGRDSKYENSDDNLEEYRKLLVDTTRISIQNATDCFVNLQILANNKKDIALFLAELADYFKDIFFWKKNTVAPAMAMNVANSQVENIFLFQEEDHGWVEPIVLYGQKNSRRWGNKGFRGTFSNLIETKTASGENKNAKIHNATFPVELVNKFILKGYNESSLVLDLFLGTGTTLIACEKTNRICYGMEIDPKYVDVIIKRYEDYTGARAIKK
jgi:site-specific DNA-methyltransferase (adenine-specific)